MNTRRSLSKLGVVKLGSDDARHCLHALSPGLAVSMNYNIEYLDILEMD